MSISSDENIDPIIRVEVARLAVDSVAQQESLSSLASVFKNSNSSQTSAFGHIVGSLLTRAAFKQSIEIRPWALLLSELDSLPIEQLGNMSALIRLLLEYNNCQEVNNALGIASRTLFDAMTNNERLIPWLAPHVLKFIAQTYATNPVASREKINKIFLDDRFRRFGHIEIPSLAREVLNFAGDDPEIIVELYYRVFLGGNFSSDHITSMSNSWILSLTSNAAQDFKSVFGNRERLRVVPTL